MAPRYVKKILEFSQRETSAESIAGNLLVTPTPNKIAEREVIQ
jgi:hypothetical protein